MSPNDNRDKARGELTALLADWRQRHGLSAWEALNVLVGWVRTLAAQELFAERSRLARQARGAITAEPPPTDG